MASGSAPPPALLYACIAYHTTILTEHTTPSAATSTNLVNKILSKITHTTSEKLSCAHEDRFIHYIADGPPSSTTTSTTTTPTAPGLTYLVIAPKTTARALSFAFLTELRTRFLTSYPPTKTTFSSLPPYGAAAFNAPLRKLLFEFSAPDDSNPHTDAITSVRKEIDGVRGIMTKNIEAVLERGERIDVLIDKTDRLGGSAADFRVKSRGLKRRMWWKNVRLMALLIVVVVFVIYLGVGFGCGLPAWGKCVG